MPLLKAAEYKEYTDNLYMDFCKESSVYVGDLVRFFDKKKQSHGLKTATRRTTGRIDMRRLQDYKFTNEIFKEKIIFKKDKNHGLYVLIDWSGSISQEILNMVKQAIILAKFSRKVGVKFSVFAFSDAYGRHHPNVKDVETTGYVVNSDLKLLQFLSSDQSMSSFEESAKFLFMLGVMIASRGHDPYYNPSKGATFPDPDFRKVVMKKYGLGGTPLDAALVSTKEYLEQQVAIKKIENTSLVVLTDGMSSSLYSNLNGTRVDSYYSTLIDPKTNKQIECDSRKVGKLPVSGNYRGTYTILNWIRTSGVNLIGFFFTRDGHASAIRNFYNSYGNGLSKENVREEIKNKFDVANKINGVSRYIDAAGYDDFFIVNPKQVFSEEESVVAQAGSFSNSTTKAIAKSLETQMSTVRAKKFIAETFINRMCEVL